MENILNHNIPFQKYFEEISRIPHGSYNEKELADYLEKFAKKHGLFCYHDAMHNVLIKKPGQHGGQDAEPVLMQCHIDMVCVKEPDSSHDFETDAIPLVLKGNILSADGTTLGADDGTGIATILPILEDTTHGHPPIEALFTVQEEVGMFGIKAFDFSQITAKRMIGLDSGGENLSSVNAAGCGTIEIQNLYPVKSTFADTVTITLNGLQGGHSGCCIDMERGNAIQMVAAMMRKLHHNGIDFRIGKMTGGQASNAIPDGCKITFATSQSNAVNQYLAKYNQKLKRAYQYNEPNLSVTIESTGERLSALSQEDSLAVVNLLTVMPNGRHHKSVMVENFVTVSSNVAQVSLEKGAFTLMVSTRAEDEFKHDIIEDRVITVAESFGCTAVVLERTPCWEHMSKSKMRKTAAKIMEKHIGKPLVPEFVHGGLECGYFAKSIPGMDIFVTGCIGADVHTPKEWCDLESANRVMGFMVEFLELLAQDKNKTYHGGI